MAVRQTDVDSLIPLSPAVFHILVALSEGKLHGYGIMQSVARTAGVRHRMGPGTIYGCIERMESAGLVREAGIVRDGRRRLYEITPLGRRALRAESARIAQLAELLNARGLAPREV